MESRILPAAPSTLGEIETHLANGIEEEDVVEWDTAARGGQQPAGTPGRLGPAGGAPPEPGAESGGRCTPRGHQAHRSPRFTLDRRRPEDAALLQNLSSWLGPHLGGLRRLDDLGRLDLADILLSSGGTGPGGPAAGAVRGHRDPPGGSGNDSGDPASALSGGPAGPSDA